MSVISLYTTNPEIQSSLAAVLKRLNQEGPDPVSTEHFASFSAFLESGKRNPRRILMLAQEGTTGVELAATAVEECPESPVVWLSDLDFALFSYRLEVDHFALLPGTEETLRSALSSCSRKLKKCRASPPLCSCKASGRNALPEEEIPDLAPPRPAGQLINQLLSI